MSKHWKKFLSNARAGSTIVAYTYTHRGPSNRQANIARSMFVAQKNVE